MSAPEVFLQRLGQDAAPPILGAQLLRILHEGAEEAGNPAQGRDRRLAAPVAGGDRQPGLAGMAGLAGDPVQQERSAGDRLAGGDRDRPGARTGSTSCR